MRNCEGKSGQLAEYDQKWKHSLATVKQTKTKVTTTLKEKKRKEAGQVSACWVLVGTESTTTCCTPRVALNLWDPRRSGQVAPPERLGTKGTPGKLRRRVRTLAQADATLAHADRQLGAGMPLSRHRLWMTLPLLPAPPHRRSPHLCPGAHVPAAPGREPSYPLGPRGGLALSRGRLWISATVGA